MSTTTCPVLAFTPIVEMYLGRFDHTHTLMNADGRSWWQPFEMFDPKADSRDTHAIALLRRVHDDLVRPRPKTEAPKEGNG